MFAKLEKDGFLLINIIKYAETLETRNYEYNKDCIIIDLGFDKTKEIFDYSLYCDIQNKYMNQYNRLFRFNIFNKEDLSEIYKT